MLVSIQRNWNSHTPPMRMQDGTAILEHRLAVKSNIHINMCTPMNFTEIELYLKLPPN